jgi:hypothetical protein
MQEAAIKINKNERSYCITHVSFVGCLRRKCFQAISYNEDSGVGCLLRIHGRTIISLAEPIIQEQPRGLQKAEFLKNGKRQVPCYGSMANVSLSLIL